MTASKLKRLNAYISLIIILLFFIHTIYEIITYITFYYNPMLTLMFGYVLGALVLIHAIISIINVFVLHDSKTVRYKQFNIGTYLQRISAFLMVALLPVHLFSFDILMSSGIGTVYVLTEIGNSLFLVAVFVHIATSFSRALISVGLLYDDKVKRKIDIALMTMCPIICTVSIVVTIVTHVAMNNI